MNALQNSTCNTDQNQILKPDIYESECYINCYHPISMFEDLQLLRKYVVRDIKC